MTDDRLQLKFGGSLVEQLGAQLYPSVTATVAELVSNAWDADATRVWIQIPFGRWKPDDEIIVLDDGHGMTRQQAQDTYLVVGRKRRLQFGNKSESKKRLVHGRKGIGKLAAFGTAGLLDCTTIRSGERTDFRLDYDNIRRLRPTDDYTVEEIPNLQPLTAPTGEPLDQGTRVRLSRLKLKKSISRDLFMRSMSRRFALNENEMQIFINTEDRLKRFDIECQFRFPRDGVPNDDVREAADDWAEETLIDGEGNSRLVRWWIGFTEKPLDDDSQQGISIIANGKMAQRPFKFETSQGTEGQLGQEYLVGEAHADWLDTGADIEDDLIQSNRDQLQLEDERIQFFLEWGRKRLRWALKERNRLRREKTYEKITVNDDVKRMLEPYTKTEQRRFLNVAKTVSRIPEIDEQGIADTMKSVVDAQSEKAVREMMEEIEQEDDAFQERVWQIVHDFGLIDARRLLSIIKARLATIRKLKDAIKQGAREVPEIHKIVIADPWLLDPRWNIIADEVDVSTLGVSYEPEQDEEGLRLDFMFALAPHAPARLDEIIVVEIKRGTDSKGRERRVTPQEINKFHLYVLAVREYYQKSTEHPTVRGLMITQGYTAQANGLRRSLESSTDIRLAFRTWDRVIEETERMHVAWLNVSQERIAGG
ncbi:ATP-binding protein [Actinomadura madurae]|uniref:ATP-binding protein n=1 Tax=Actinomadura madurae TaxID=1993 RepID=UPI00399A8237